MDGLTDDKLFGDTLGMGSENVPSSEFLFKTNIGGLWVFDHVSGACKSIPHNFGLLTDGEGSKFAQQIGMVTRPQREEH